MTKAGDATFRDGRHNGRRGFATLLSFRPPELAWTLLVFSIVVIPLLIWKRHHYPMPIDLAVYRLGGRAIIHGRDLYAAKFGSRLGVILPFTYPPFAAILAVPIGILPGLLATALWMLACLGVLLWMVSVSFGPFLARLGSKRGIALGLIAGSLAWTTPVADTLFFGQVNLFILALCLGDCVWTKKSRGIAVGIATAVKLIPGLFICYFAVTRQWRAFLRSSITFLGCSLFAAGIAPASSWHYWTSAIFHIGRVGKLSFFPNQSLKGLLLRVYAPGWTWVVLALVVACFGLNRAMIAHRRGDDMTAATLVGLTSLLVSPVSWQHHAVWIVPAVGLILWDGRSVKRIAQAGLFLVAFLIRFPFIGSVLQKRHAFRFAVILTENAYVYFFLVLVLILPLAGQRLRQDRGLTGSLRPGHRMPSP